ncbi:MAG: hypothetical protein H3C54_14685 [Taibaiella sp.]|nr:hypothetical protein [Taibaiella sp.]
MKIEHELFAHHYILTGDKDKAYKAAYPHATGEALKIAARRLVNHPDVRQYISERLAATQQEAVNRYHEKEQRLAEQEYATMLLKRKQLRAIIAGELKIKKYYRVKDRLEMVETDMPPFMIIRAIEADTKLANDWYARKGQPADEPVAVTPKTWTPPESTFTMEEFCNLRYGPDYYPGLRAKMVHDNPRKAKEYAEKGERVLDYIPTNEDIKRMEEEQMRKYDEWRELKKFADEQLAETGYYAGEGAQQKEEEQEDGDTVAPPPVVQSFPRVAEKFQADTPAAIQNDTERYKLNDNGLNETNNESKHLPRHCGDT